MRKPRRSPSNQRLEAEGWENKEPTEVIDLALERVKKCAAEATKELRTSRESLSRTSREFHHDIEEAVRAVTDSEPPPLLEEEVAAASR